MAKDQKKIKLGFIGVGLRGREHLRLALLRDDVSVKALCDIDSEAISISEKMIRESGSMKSLPHSKMVMKILLTW